MTHEDLERFRAKYPESVAKAKELARSFPPLTQAQIDMLRRAGMVRPRS